MTRSPDAWMGQVAMGLQTDLFPHSNCNFLCILFIGSRVSIRSWCYHRNTCTNLSAPIVFARSIKKHALICWSLPPFHASVAPICNTQYYHQIPIISSNARMYQKQKWSQKSGIWLWNFFHLCYFIKAEFPLIIHYIILLKRKRDGPPSAVSCVVYFNLDCYI